MNKLVQFLIFVAAVIIFLTVVFYVKTGCFFSCRNTIESVEEWQNYLPPSNLDKKVELDCEELLVMLNDTFTRKEKVVAYTKMKAWLSAGSINQHLDYLTNKKMFDGNNALWWFFYKVDEHHEIQIKTVIFMWGSVFEALGLKKRKKRTAPPGEDYSIYWLSFKKLFFSDTKLARKHVVGLTGGSNVFGKLYKIKPFLNADTSQVSPAANQYFREILSLPIQGPGGRDYQLAYNFYNKYRILYGIPTDNQFSEKEKMWEH